MDSEDWEMEALRASGRSALGSAVASAEESLEVQPVTWELLFNWLCCCLRFSPFSFTVSSLLARFVSNSINNIRKVYKEKDNVVEALRGECFSMIIHVVQGYSMSHVKVLYNVG